MQPASAIADGGDFQGRNFLVGCLPGGKWIWRCRPHCGGQGARVSYKGTGGFVAPLFSRGNVLIKIARKSRLTRLAASTMFNFKNSVVGSHFKPQYKTYAKGLRGILRMQEGLGPGR